MAEPIKFTDLIKPDDTINELIQQLRDAKDAYEKLAKSVKTESGDIAKALQSTSGATEEGKQKILELAAAADKLAQAEKAVSSAIDNIQKSEKGLVQAQKEAAAAAEASVDYMEDLRKEVEKAKREAAEHAKKLQEQANAQKQVTQTTQQAAKAQKEEATEIEHAVDSYKALKKELKDLTKLFRTLSAEERIDPELGGDLAAEIRALKKELSDIDAMLTPHVSKMTELEKTEKAFAFASSDAGKQVAWLKAQIAAVNKEYVSSRTALQHAIGSYDSLKATLKQLSTEYKAMSASDRQGPSGQALLSSILETKTAMSQLEAQMKPYTQALTQLEKAKQKLAYLQTNEGRELLEIRAQINAIVAERRKQEQVLTDIEKAKRKLNFAQSEENMQLKLYATQIQEANRVAELRVRIANSEEGSYNRLSAQYALNKIRLNQMGEADEKAAQAKRELEAETKALYQQMIKLQEATGNHTLSVGNYKKVWNGLGMSVNQIVRELPAAAISLNTFFLGISNNVPILMDEIKKVRDLNAKLRAEGKQTKSVIGEVTKALFSWNTVMVLLLTVFAMHGEAILEWASKLIFGKKQALSLKEALNGISEELNSSGASYGEQVTLVQKLAEKYRALGGDIKKQEQFLKDYADDINSLGVSVTDLNDAETLFVSSTEAFITSLKLRARATAAMSLAAEEYKKELVAATKAETSESTQPSFWQGVWSMVGNYSAEGAQEDFIAQQQKIVQGFKDEAAAAKAAGDQYFDLSKMYEKMADDQLATLGLDKFTKRNKGSKEPKGPRPKDTEDTLEVLSLSATKAYQDSITKLEREEIKKRRKEYLEAYNTEVADLARKYNKIQRILDGQDSRYKKLTEEQKEQALKAQDEIVKAVENKQKAVEQNLALLTYQQQEQEARAQLETLNLQIDAVKRGSEEELRLRLQILRVEEQIALARNKQLPPSQQQDESTIKAGFKKQRTEITTGFNDTAFEQSQALEKAKFDAVKHNEQQITQFTLQQEKERWEHQIQLAEAGALDWSQAQIDAAKETVKGINRQLKENESFIARVGERGFTGALFESFGWNEDQIDAMQQATNIVVDQFGAILDAEVALAEKEKQLADERVQRAQDSYKAEIEARNAGLAADIEGARKELDLAKRQQQEKQRMLEQAQRRQAALDTVMQTSSLITASANLWSSFSKLGPFGPALAIAAIATMWGSFVAAKIKARQVTATQEYGEGGFEVLEGGSHASGHDIDLGTTNKKGKRMKAEGGEALAIINKRNTRKYKKVLPEIVESLNKGIFEDKYMTTFSAGQSILVAQMQQSQSSVNLSHIEETLGDIKKQGDTRYFYGSNGEVIEVKANVKRIIRN